MPTFIAPNEIIGNAYANSLAVSNAEFLASAQSAQSAASMSQMQASYNFTQWGVGVLVCFSIQTFNASQGGTGTFAQSTFNPLGGNLWTPGAVNVQQWCAVAKAAGAKYIALTVKAQDGFCLWNTVTTPYAINGPGSATWFAAAGNQDIFAAFVAAAAAYGLGVGIYFITTDWNLPIQAGWAFHASGGNAAWPWTYTAAQMAAYKAVVEAQLVEIFTKYGPIQYMFFDHGFTPDGFPPFASYNEAVNFVHNLQPITRVAFNVNGLLPGQTDIQEWTSSIPPTINSAFDVQALLPREHIYSAWNSQSIWYGTTPQTQTPPALPSVTAANKAATIAAGDCNWLLSYGADTTGAIGWPQVSMTTFLNQVANVGPYIQFLGGFPQTPPGNYEFSLTQNAWTPNSDWIHNGQVTAASFDQKVIATLAANSTWTTSDTVITMGVSNPGTVIPGMSVYDGTGSYAVGNVLTYVGTTLTLAATAANGSTGATDSLRFSPNLISAPSWTGTPTRYASYTQYANWTDGSQTVSATGSRSGTYVVGANTAWSFTVPADTTDRQVTILCTFAGPSGPPDITCTLSDGSAGPLVTSLGGYGNCCMTFGYRAGTAGQTLTVAWNATSNSGCQSSLQWVLLNEYA